MKDAEFLNVLATAEADAIRYHLPWLAPMRELHGFVAGKLEDLEARMAALEERAAPPAPRSRPAPRPAIAAVTQPSEHACEWCGKRLTIEQARRGQRFCSRRCNCISKHGEVKRVTDGAIAGYYGEVSRPATARETVVTAGVGVRDGRRIAS